MSPSGFQGWQTCTAGMASNGEAASHVSLLQAQSWFIMQNFSLGMQKILNIFLALMQRWYKWKSTLN